MTIWLIGWMITIGIMWEEEDSKWWMPFFLFLFWPVTWGALLKNLMDKIDKDENVTTDNDAEPAA